MSTPTHTPAPWHVRQSHASNDHLMIASDRVANIACCRNADDAYVIAAAPELLAALTTARNLLDNCGVLFDPVATAQIVSAIAKAQPLVSSE